MRIIYIVFITLIIIAQTSSCRLSSYLQNGELLYDGIDKINIENNDKRNKEYLERALAEAKSTLEYDDNKASINLGITKIPLVPIRTWLYMSIREDSSFAADMLRKFATPPIMINEVNPPLRAKVAEAILNEYGYLGAKINSTEYPNPKDSLSIAVSYDINPGRLYTYDSIIPFKTIKVNDSTFIDINKYAKIKKNAPFSTKILMEERANIADSLRRKGFYYFRPDMIIYKADTLLINGAATIKKEIKENIPDIALKPWHIGNINVRLFSNTISNINSEVFLKDTIKLDNNITLYYNDSPLVRKAVLNRRILLRPDSLYSSRIEENTLKALSNLGAFSSSEFIFTRRDSASNSNNYLDLNIILRPDRPWDISLETLFKTKSNNFMGPGLNLTLTKNNIFGGGETLSSTVYGSYEWQIGRSPFSKNAISINSYQFGADIDLSIPSLLFPGKINQYYRYPTTTNIKLSTSILNRPSLYRLMSMGFNFNYEFQPTIYLKHNIQLFNLNYTLLQNTSNQFLNLIEENPSLGLSIRDQFIPQISYSIVYDNITNSNRKHHIWFRFSISEAGNLTNGIMAASGKDFNKQKELFGVPFAQFIKSTSELRYTYSIDKNQSLASRISLGAIYSYGNALVSPFIEQFYVGGASSIRAFTVRSIGPGKFIPKDGTYAFMDQVGDLKLEANIEYRARLWGNLSTAIFVDSGNVWLIRKDFNRIGASISEITGIKDFINQIAVGTGVGLRYDLGFIALRLDSGFGLHLPYNTGISSWYNINNFKDAWGIHLAVGYPF